MEKTLRKIEGDKRELDVLQMARVIGNQAVVMQMCTDWDSDEAWAIWDKFKNCCTENFVRRHLCGIKWAGEDPPTKISKRRVREVVKAYKKQTIQTGPDGWCVYKGEQYVFTNNGKLCHYVPHL